MKMALPLHHLLPYLLLFTYSMAAPANTTTESENEILKVDTYPIPGPILHHLLSQPVAAPKQLDPPSLVEMIMFGLAGIPVYKAVGMLLPFLMGKRGQQKNNGRVLNRRSKRDLAYAQQLLQLLVSVEVSLEKYGITQPQCQLRATCEIYRKNGVAGKNAVAGKNKYEGNFIKLVNEMRREIQNPKVVPLAKYVFEYYEEAAIRGETQCNCRQMYPKCSKSLSQFYKKTKGKKPLRGY